MAGQMLSDSGQDELNLLLKSSVNDSLWGSLKSNLRAALFPEQLPPLQLTSKPVSVDDINSGQGELDLLLKNGVNDTLWSSLKSNLRAALFPEKLPPLQLTSRPVAVRDIWDRDTYKKQSAGVSVAVHVVAIAAVVGISIMGARAVKNLEKPKMTVELIAPDLTPQLPKKKDTMGGGGAAVIAISCKHPRASCPSWRWSRSHPRRSWFATNIPNSQLSRRWWCHLKSSWRRTCLILAIRCQPCHPDLLQMAPAAAEALAQAQEAVWVQVRDPAWVLGVAVVLAVVCSTSVAASPLRVRWILLIRNTRKKRAERNIRGPAFCGSSSVPMAGRTISKWLARLAWGLMRRQWRPSATGNFSRP